MSSNGAKIPIRVITSLGIQLRGLSIGFRWAEPYWEIMNYPPVDGLVFGTPMTIFTAMCSFVARGEWVAALQLGERALALSRDHFALLRIDAMVELLRSGAGEKCGTMDLLLQFAKDR